MKTAVWLTGNHQNFCERRWSEGPARMADPEERGWKQLTEDLLEQPIIGYNGREIIDAVLLDTYRAALRALGSLEGFEVAISFGVSDTDPAKLRSPKREWVKIYLKRNGMLVDSFTHDTRYKNKPYTGLMEWLDQDLVGERLEEGCRQWATVEKWREFFITSMKQRRTELLEEAYRLKNEVESLHRRAVLIRQGIEWPTC